MVNDEAPRAKIRGVRRAVIVAVVLGLFGAVTTSSIAEAGEPHHLEFSVTTVVAGEPSPGTVVQVECATPDAVLPHSVRLGFDATGRATVAAGDTAAAWKSTLNDGTWIFTSDLPSTRTTCTFTEVDTGGAAEIDWACVEGQVGGPLGLGCAADAGAGPGPISVLIGASNEDISVQAVRVIFTNTFRPTPVVVTPSFTG
jgi:hypothetical protein